ncbi:hypothetical protein ACOMHN_006532 [Nucella lapillus]
MSLEVSLIRTVSYGLSDRVHLLLFSLALADLTHLLTHLLLTGSCYISDPLHLRSWIAMVNADIIYLNLWSAFVSGMLIVLMSVDRCVFVVVPLAAKRIITYRTVITAIVLSCLVPLTCYLPGFLTFTVKWRIDSSANRSVAYVATSGWFPMDARRAILVVDLLFVIVKPVCLVTVSLCCSITIIHLRRAYPKRSEMTTTGKNEDKDDGNVRITWMLLFLCVTYSVLVLPEVCQAFVFLFVPESDVDLYCLVL